MMFQCELCKEVLKSDSARGFTDVMRRHRNKKHPQKEGAIKYTQVELKPHAKKPKKK